MFYLTATLTGLVILGVLCCLVVYDLIIEFALIAIIIIGAFLIGIPIAAAFGLHP